MSNLEEIVARLPRFREAAETLRETLLANLTLIGETPAPTFHEEERVRLMAERLSEAGLQNCSLDADGNGIGLLPGTEGKQNILLVANADTAVSDEQDQTIEIQTDRVIGPFVGDNSIALAGLVTLPALLDALEIRLKSNVIFLATTRALGRGNLEGIRNFLARSGYKFDAALCIESVQLGRLNYSCMGMLRGEIVCRLPRNYDWAQFGATGTIIPMSDIIGRISRIPLPPRPLTSIVMGSLHGGFTYNNVARETTLHFEVRSESPEILQQLREQIADITEDVAGQSGKEVALDVFAQREPGGIEISHPLVRKARAVLTGLGLQPQLYATISLQAALRDMKIPALTLGITTGERKSELDEVDESAAIGPMSIGMAQLPGILRSIDDGVGA
jgi:di/tripeptidase